MTGDPTLERIARGGGLALCAAGLWTARFAPVLEQIVQQDLPTTSGGPVEVVMITHRAREGGIRSALAAIESENFMHGPTRLFRIEDA